MQVNLHNEFPLRPTPPVGSSLQVSHVLELLIKQHHSAFEFILSSLPRRCPSLFTLRSHFGLYRDSLVRLFSASSCGFSLMGWKLGDGLCQLALPLQYIEE